ncbi:hypothetical protein DFH06DRAFT_1157251, partial [Mycena polygramma]
MSYAPDWLITIALAAVFFSLDKVHGFRRQFSLEDTSYDSSYQLCPLLTSRMQASVIRA